jgi:hypothetical protein
VLGDRARHQFGRATRRRQIDGDGRHPVEAFKSVDRSRAGDDRRALAGQLPRHRHPDALAGTGDDGDFPLEAEVHQTKRWTNFRAVSQTGRQPLPIVRPWLAPSISTISVTPLFFSCFLKIASLIAFGETWSSLP